MNIIAQDIIVASAYKLLGPENFFQAIQCTQYILALVWDYPYASAAIVSMLLMIGNIYPRWRGIVRRQKMNNMMTNIDTRLQGVEEQHKRMEKQLNVIVKQNEELKSQMAKLLSSRLATEESH